MRLRLLSPPTLVALALLVPARADADIYVTNQGANDVIRYDGSGHASVYVDVPTPEGLAFDQAGNLYVGSLATNQIYKFSPSGQSLGTLAASAAGPGGMVVGPDGNLYVSEIGRGDVLQISTATGNVIKPFATGISAPEPLAFDSSGNLLVGSFNTNTIRRFDSAGHDIGSFTVGDSSIFQITGLAFDPAGNLFVSTNNSQIHKLLPGGTDVQTITSPSLPFPEGLAYDPTSGNLLVPDLANGLIESISTSGADLGSFATGLNKPIYVVIGPTPVPEPASLALLAGGGVLLVSASRRIRRRA